MPTVLKSGSLILLEPSGPVQACNGIALPFTFKGPVILTHWRGGWVVIGKGRVFAENVISICGLAAGSVVAYRPSCHGYSLLPKVTTAVTKAATVVE